MGIKNLVTKKFIVVILAGLFFCATLTQQIPVSVLAAPAMTKKPTLEWRAKTWLLISYLRRAESMGNVCKFKNNISDTDITNLNILTDGNVKQAIGILVAPAGGNMTCNEVEQTLLTYITAWGYSGETATADFLTAMGYTKTGAAYSFSGDALGAMIENGIPAEFFTNGNRSEPSQDVLYYVYNQAFETGCHGTPYKLFSAGTAEEQEQAAISTDSDKTSVDQQKVNINGKDYYLYKVWSTTSGQVESYIYTSDVAAANDVTIGFGLIYGNVRGNKEDDAKENCREIGYWLGNNKSAAEAYLATAAYEKEHPDEFMSEPDTGVTTDPSQVCENAMPPLGWIICPILNMVDGIANLSTSLIESLLIIRPNEYGEAGNQNETNPLKTAWSAIRILSTVILVGIALFMLLSQILNMDMVSAYTIKKVMPRLVIAVILMQLSWFICTSLIGIFNVLGEGIQELMFAPFGGKEIVSDIQSIMATFASNSGVGAVAGGTVIAGFATVAGISAIGGAFGILAAIVGIALSIAVAVCVLVLRKVIIVILLVLAPLAFVLWILTNTEKYWKTWWELFSKLLIMFPIVMALLAIGRVFAYLTAQYQPSGAVDKVINFFVIIIAYFGPLFLIPKTFALAGGLFAKVTGALGGAGGKLRGVDIGGFKRRGDANLKMRKDAKKLEGYQMLNSESGWNKMRGRWRTDTMGGKGIMGRTRRAYDQRLLRAGAGIQDTELKNAEMEFSDATSDIVDFPTRVKDAEGIATATIGTHVTLSNGKSVVASEYMKQHAASFLIQTKQGDAVRRVKDHMTTGPNSPVEERIWAKTMNVPSNVGKVLEAMPDVAKPLVYQELTAGAASKMDNGAWRNMSARTRFLTDEIASGRHAVGSDAHREMSTELSRITNISKEVQMNPEFAEDMTQEKYEAAEAITGLRRTDPNAPAGPGNPLVSSGPSAGGGQIIRDATGNPAKDAAGRKPGEAGYNPTRLWY